MNLHLHLAGKTGELLYASGIFPACRQRYPGARLVLHLHPHYVPVAAGLEHKPDDVAPYGIARPRIATAHQVNDCVRGVFRALNWKPPAPTVIRGADGDLHALLYATHVLPERKPFYRMFMDAAGVGDLPYALPSWWPAGPLPSYHARGEISLPAVVFPTADVFTGKIRGLQLAPAQWEELAAEVRARHMEPVATGHQDDGRPDMPGWTWLESEDVRPVLELLLTAERVVGCNSGIVFAACRLAPGSVTMLDTQGRAEYKFSSMVADGVIDPARHAQIPWLKPDGDLFEVVRAALR